MNCRYCKKDIEDDSVFCRFCGERVQRARRKPKDEISVAPPALTPSGKYRGRVMVSGSRVWITEETEAAYYVRARAVKAGMIEQVKALPREMLCAIIDKYLTDNEAVLSPATVRSFTSMRKTRFKAYMDQPVSKIVWQKMISDETEKVKPKTVSNAWGLISCALKYANLPVPDVKLPKIPRTDRNFLDYEQIQKLLPVIRGDSCEIVYLLALHSLRMSEILALSDCDGSVIRVRGAVVRGKNGLIKKDQNKTYLSARDVPVMIPRLLDLIDRLPVSVCEKTINRHLKKIAAGAGLPDVSLHCLRHSFASLAYHLRWTEKTTMQLGGWSTPKVVHEIYTHLSTQDVNEDIDKMKAFYEGKTGTVSKSVSKNAR